MKKLLLLLAAITFSMINSHAWNIYNTSNSGIPSNNIRGIDFDQQGNTWIATDSGLVKFNGITWQVFNTANSGISSNDIICIKVDKYNTKWIGTSNGLSKYNDTTWVNYTISNSGLPDNYIYNIQTDKYNNIYITFQPDYFTPSNNKGYCVFNGTSWTQYKVENSSLYSNSIRQLLIDSLNRKWIIYTSLAKYTIIDSADNWVTYNNPEFGGVLSIAEGEQGNMWFGLQRSIGLLTDTGWISFALPTEIPDIQNSYALAWVWYNKKIEKNSNVWTVIIINNATYLCSYDIKLQKWTIFRTETAPIRSNYGGVVVYQDKLNNTWIRAQNGLVKLKCISNLSPTLKDSNYYCLNDSIMLKYAGNKTPSLWYSEKNGFSKNTSNYFTLQDTGICRLYFTDDNGCSILGSSVYNIGKSFISQITSNQNISCLRNNSFKLGYIYSEDSTGSSVKWNLVKTASTIKNPTISYDTAGIYNISLISKSVGGCIDTAYQTLTVNPNPTSGPMLGVTNALVLSTPYVYTVAQQPNHSYNWVVSNGIIAAGQGTNAATVQWISNGKGYLKVEITNAQGCSDTTATAVNIGNVGLNELSNINRLLVYPNPSNGSFTVSLNALKSASSQMTLVNLLGQEIWSETVMIKSGEQNIAVNANLAPGIYTIHVTSQDDQIQQKVIIK